MGAGGGGGGGQDRRTDVGWITASTLAQAAMVAVAGINTAAAISMNAKQMKIADGYLQLAQQLRDYWMAVFVPCETKIVTEACNTPIYQPQYDLQAGRATAAVRAAFKKKMDDIRCLGRYCTGLSAAMVKDLTIAESVAIGNAVGFAYRYEETRKEAKDDQRFSRIMSALGLGRNLPMEALSYSKAAQGAYGTLGQQAAQGAQGALQGLGYLMNKNETSIPQNQGYAVGQRLGTPNQTGTASVGSTTTGEDYGPGNAYGMGLYNSQGTRDTGTPVNIRGDAGTGGSQFALYNPNAAAGNQTDNSSAMS